MSEVHFIDTDAVKGTMLSLLKKSGYQAVDMHYHSKYSVDGLSSVHAVLEKSKKDAVGTAFTDHNHVAGALQALSLAKNKVFVIPGIELTCHNGVHVLLHFSNGEECLEFYNKEMKQRVSKNPWFIDINVDEAIDIASQYNGLITFPHPYGPGFCGIQKQGASKKSIQQADAVEVLNSCCVRDMNIKAIAWAKKINKGFTGGSDGHCLAEHGTSLTICQAETAEQFLEEIRRKKSIVVGKQERLFEDGVNALHKFLREETKAPRKQVEQMWEDRFSLEWSYLKNKLEDKLFFQHYHAHHQEPKKKFLQKHEYTRHLMH
jgi:predicted metal-dependent phosphoesterase TrpH